MATGDLVDSVHYRAPLETWKSRDFHHTAKTTSQKPVIARKLSEPDFALQFTIPEPQPSMPEPQPTIPEHTVEQRQQDIEFGNRYRIEYIKHLISISAGIFAFTVTFTKDMLGQQAITTAHAKVALITGWSLLVVSIIAGILHMRFWAWFFISWGRNPHDPEEKRWRNTIMSRRRTAETVQFTAFFLALGSLALFAALNLR